MSVANYVGDPAPSGARVGGRYRLGERIGSGAGGHTYRAVDEQTGEARAVKLFRAGATTAAAAILEFRRLQSLAHPNVVRVHDVGQSDGGVLYLVMDLIAGAAVTSIAALEDPVLRREAFEVVARALADALAYLHGRDIVHADICPANIRLTDRGQPVLFDFGLSLASSRAVAVGDGSAGGGARGTLGYAAPEALVGRCGAASDLFALGATLFEVWTGAAPFGIGLEAAGRMLSARAPVLSAVRGGLGEAWDGIVARLLAPRPEERHTSGRELLREIARVMAGPDSPVELELGAPFPGGDPLAGILVGRQAEREALRLVIEQLAEGAAPCSVVVLAGPSGCGRRTVIDVAVRDATVAQAASLLPAFTVWRGDLDGLARYLQLAPARMAPVSSPSESDPSRVAESHFAAIAEALERQASVRPLCVVLDGDVAPAPARAFATFMAGAEPSGRTLIVLPAAAAIERKFARTVALGPLGPGEIGELISRAAGEPPPPDAVATIARISAGHAGVVAALARRLVEAIRRGDRGQFRVEDAADGTLDLQALLRSGLAGLRPEVRRLVTAVTLFAGDMAPANLDAAEEAEACDDARRAGWLLLADGRAQLPSALHREVAVAALADPDLRDLAARAVATLPADDLNRAGALAALGEERAAAESLAAIARTYEPAAAVPLWERAAALAPGVLSITDGVARVTGLGILGRYPEAVAVLDRLAVEQSRPEEAAAVAERRAWLLGRRGDLSGACAVLEAALGAAPIAGAETEMRVLRARLARVLISAGQLARALDVVAPLLADATMDAATTAAVEAAILAHAYTGQDSEARALCLRLSRVRADESNPVPSPRESGERVRERGRVLYLDALVDQLGGRMEAAVPQYRQSFELAAAAHDVHTLATVALNLGALLAEQGAYGEALSATERAIRELGRLGSTAELGTALLNAANLFVVLGELGSARRMLARARDEAASRGAPMVEDFALFVDGDLERRRGQPVAAARLYRNAAARLRRQTQSQPGAAAAALIGAVEALCEAGQHASAASALAEAVAERAGEAAAADELDVERARARLILAGAGPADAAAAPMAVALHLQRLAGERAAQGRRPAAWRGALLAARLADHLGAQPAAQTCLAEARCLFQEIQMATPEQFRPGLASDPDALWLRGATASTAQDAAGALRAAHTENRLRRLLRINKRLNSELRLPRLLETIIDTVIELTDAERGFILLEDETGELSVRVARNIDQRTLETPELALSRSIARQAAAGGEPIVTIDAAGDDRFKEAVSVSDLHLRSVLAVPLLIKGRSAGTIYVDHRLRKGAFDQDDVNLVLDFAEQAAIALENARLLSQLRRRERQVEALNRRLEVELGARREELSGMKQELRENREALAVRYDYRNIVGRTPRMLELFRLLDRITDTTLPVVIQGESGTGKELVARALHFNGPRRARAFVSESCAAIPETLLESTLFGYVRGAFTGADHDTRGLFEVADGGTLFLDEIGEMSPAMQGKLLRVLQEGEFRRVGGERTRKVDVRVVAATNRDLARMVEEGKFRQDLYFRLSVARIFLPPLRERREDVPLIVEHLLVKHSAGAARKPIDPAALNALCAYRWPGNVRELENEIMRAVALSAERITLGDLSPAVAAHGDGAAAAPENPDSLLLRPRVERLERSLLREALGRYDNNQTKAADALGLSRFGLQKKLKRYRFA